ELVGHHLEPGRPHAGPFAGGVVAVQQGDVPLLDPGAAVEHQRGPGANGRDPLGGGPHRLDALPGAGSNASAGLAVDQQREPDTARHLVQRGHDDVTNMRNPDVDRQWLCLDGGGACEHLDPSFVGACIEPAPVPPPGPSATFLLRATAGNDFRGLPAAGCGRTHSQLARLGCSAVGLSRCIPMCWTWTPRVNASWTSPMRSAGSASRSAATACATCSSRTRRRVWRSSRRVPGPTTTWLTCWNGCFRATIATGIRTAPRATAPTTCYLRWWHRR